MSVSTHELAPVLHALPPNQGANPLLSAASRAGRLPASLPAHLASPRLELPNPDQPRHPLQDLLQVPASHQERSQSQAAGYFIDDW